MVSSHPFLEFIRASADRIQPEFVFCCFDRSGAKNGPKGADRQVGQKRRKSFLELHFYRVIIHFRYILYDWAKHPIIPNPVAVLVVGVVLVHLAFEVKQDRVGVAEIAVMKAYTKYADRLCFDQHAMPYAALQLAVAKGERDRELLDAIEDATKQDRAGLPGASMISDAFFPFRDGIDVGIRQGVTAVAHPGGSIRDFESIEACNEAVPQVAMVFTGQRAFKH